MFCGKCGAENDGNSMFCKNCGAPLTQVRKAQGAKIVPKSDSFDGGNSAESSAAPIKLPKLSPKIIGAVFAAIAALLVIIAIAVNASMTININKYLKIKTEGVDGYGKASVEVDWDAIEEKYGTRLEFTKKGQSEYGGFAGLMKPVEGVIDAVDIKVDPTSKLSNGDEVKYTIKVNEELSECVNCKIKAKDGTYKVSGLAEVEKFDAFADVNLVYSGIAPNGHAELEYNGEELSSHNYRIENNNGLSNGDKVKVTIDEDFIDAYAEEHGKAPETLEKEYTVEGLSSFVAKISEITDEGLSSMKSQAEDVFKARAAQNYGEGEELKSLDYIGDYLLTAKGNSGNYNYLYLVYKAEIHNSYKTYDKVNEVYWYTAFRNLMTDGEGKLVVDTNSYDIPSHRVEIDSKVSSGWFGTKSWYYYGFASMNDLYKEVVTTKIDAYNHEDNINGDEAPTISDSEAKGEGNADYLLPNSDKELISEDDLEGFDAEKCKLARNEIYARHGRKFKDEELQSYFDAKEWYEGTIDPDDFNEESLSETEIKNKDTIVKYEEEKGFR
ncbi:MAG: YARHG domain-containing protein [Butyrivibrio sp.]|nr:YARHG domain-containing protein [Butyrivibrio sp.]